MVRKKPKVRSKGAKAVKFKRKPKPEPDNQGNRQFNCWLSPADIETVDEMKRTLGISKSAFVRMCIKVGKEAAEAQRAGEILLRQNPKTGESTRLLLMAVM